MKPKASTSRRLQENQNPEEPPFELRSKFGVTTQVRGFGAGLEGFRGQDLGIMGVLAGPNLDSFLRSSSVGERVEVLLKRFRLAATPGHDATVAKDGGKSSASRLDVQDIMKLLLH